ncbi:TPA: ogr/Delta-like zinc finger family protein [Serratia marcescens]
MFPCNKCGSAANVTSVFQIKEGSYRRFHQCRNIFCGHCFTTLEEIDHSKEKIKTGQCNNILPGKDISKEL